MKKETEREKSTFYSLFILDHKVYSSMSTTRKANPVAYVNVIMEYRHESLKRKHQPLGLLFFQTAILPPSPKQGGLG